MTTGQSSDGTAGQAREASAGRRAVGRRARAVLSVVIDNSVGMTIVMASAEGGVEIEEVAARDPGRDQAHSRSIQSSDSSDQGRELAIATV